MKRLLLFTAGLALAAVLPSLAVAGNGDSVFLGNQAAMSGGAVNAVTRDGEAAWYNPAGLGGNAQNSIDASASAFMLRMRRLPGFYETELSDTARLSLDLSGNEIISIPSALVYTRALGDRIWLGFGVFVPTADQYNVRQSKGVRTQLDSGVDVDYRQTVRLEGLEEAYYLGPSVSWRATDWLRLGASVFVVYSEQKHLVHVWNDTTARVPGVEARSFTLLDELYDVSRIGMQALLGAQVELGAWSVGASVRTPLFLIAAWGESSVLEHGASAGVPGEPGEVAVLDDRRSISERGFRAATPARLVVGGAYRFGGGWLSLDLEVAHPLSGDAELGTIDRTWTVDVRAGGRFPLNDAFTLGAGLFTDRSPAPRPSRRDIGAERVHYYGGTLGLEYRKRYEVTGEEDGDALIFSSTFALRYAAGLGTGVGGLIRPLDADVPLQGRTLDLLHHELALHIGSALYF